MAERPFTTDRATPTGFGAFDVKIRNLAETTTSRRHDQAVEAAFLRVQVETEDRLPKAKTEERSISKEAEQLPQQRRSLMVPTADVTDTTV